VPNLVPALILAALVVVAAPVWPWSRGWGWPPAAILGKGLVTLLLFSWSVVPD
jgi:hypothetical protein